MAEQSGGRNSTLRLALNGRSQNITLRLEDISKRLVKNVPDLLVDLIEIATYVYCADQATSRGGEAQTEWVLTGAATFASSFQSEIQIIGTVARSWSRFAILSFLSEDDYDFEFEKATNPVPP